MEVKTYSRRNKQESRPVLVDIDEAPTSNEQPSTAACSQAEEQTPLPVKPRPAQDGRWRRGGPDKENAVLIQKQQMAEMRQYFQEVDAFELAAETPSPMLRPRAQTVGPASPVLTTALTASESLREPALRGGGQVAGESGGRLPDLRASPEPAGSPAPALDVPEGPPPSTQQRRASRASGLSRRVSCALVAQPLPDLDAGRRSSVGGARWGAGKVWRTSLAPRLSLAGSQLASGVSSALRWVGVVQPPSQAGDEEPSHEAATSPAPWGVARASLAAGRPAAPSPIQESPGSATDEEPAGGDGDNHAAGGPSAVGGSGPLPLTKTGRASGLSEALKANDTSEPGDALELGEALRRLTLASEGRAAGEGEAAKTGLDLLLEFCGQTTVPSMEELLGQHVDLSTVRKIGEGTFGEAFKASGQVLKIVPMEGDIRVNGELQKRADDMLGEVAITKTLSALADEDAAAANSTPGFVRALGVGVGRGAYPPALLSEWHRWDAEHASENDPVDVFGQDQLYTVFIFEDGGKDLEHATLDSASDIQSILLQTTLALAVAEEAAEFEHRDLHWGNLLVKPAAPGEALRCRLRGVELEVCGGGPRCTLIDFTLSRLQTAGGALAFCDLAADPELFLGPRANAQAEAYRRMRKLTGDSWERYVPGTNAVWLHYLADTCLTQKLAQCKHTPADKVALRGFRKRVLAYASAGEAVWDEYFKGSWTATD
ncbi:hypothetical protein ACKKBG_A28625 [Auxenochlorella protothecoides x Auxenochlorella symbiontica]